MAKYRSKTSQRKIRQKIYVWSHAEIAEIQYFQSFKNYLGTHSLIANKKLCGTPWELVEKVIIWKEKNIDAEDQDQVWCVFDVDDFYENDQKKFINAINKAHKHNIKIAYSNECFELWILLHFERTEYEINRTDMVDKISKCFKRDGLGEFTKNQNVFDTLLCYQSKAIENAKQLLASYEKIRWETKLSVSGNPSTSIHFLIEEINRLAQAEPIKNV